MSVLTVIDETVLVSKLAATLWVLPGDMVGDPKARLATYPWALVAALTPDNYRALDLAACKAEMIRRALRVGKGFNANRRAA